MNYRHIYMAIICHAKSEEQSGLRKKGNGDYYENHHILPKSLFPLWKDNKNNLVLLTGREHYFCHQLLTKIYPSRPMFTALWQMTIRTSKRVSSLNITSRDYEYARKQFANSITGINNPARDFRIAYNKSETKRKQLSIQMKKLFQNSAYKDKVIIATKKQVCQKVRCLNTNQIFKSLTDAKNWCGLASSSHISDCCRGQRKFAGVHPKTGEKLQWEYIGQSPRNKAYSNYSLLDKRKDNGTSHLPGTKVRCLETGIIYDSLTLAAAWCNTTSANISEYLRYSNLTFAGRHPITDEKLHWEYVTNS